MNRLNSDHWEDFTTVTEWEKLVHYLSIKITSSFPQNESHLNHSFHFLWKRHQFKVVLHSSLRDEHYIGILIGNFPYVTIEMDADSKHKSLHVCCNEARLLISAWLLGSKESWLETISVFCSFSVDNSTNYVGYCRDYDSLTHFISHSFPFVPENTQNISMLLDWCLEKQAMIEPETNSKNSFQLELATKTTIEPFNEKYGIFLADNFDSNFRHWFFQAAYQANCL